MDLPVLYKQPMPHPYPFLLQLHTFANMLDCFWLVTFDTIGWINIANLLLIVCKLLGVISSQPDKEGPHSPCPFAFHLKLGFESVFEHLSCPFVRWLPLLSFDLCFHNGLRHWGVVLVLGSPFVCQVIRFLVSFDVTV